MYWIIVFCYLVPVRGIASYICVFSVFCRVTLLVKCKMLNGRGPCGCTITVVTVLYIYIKKNKIVSDMGKYDGSSPLLLTAHLGCFSLLCSAVCL